MHPLNETEQWSNLEQHWRDIADLHMRDLYRDDPQRFAQMHLQAAGLFLVVPFVRLPFLMSPFHV